MDGGARRDLRKSFGKVGRRQPLIGRRARTCATNMARQPFIGRLSENGLANRRRGGGDGRLGRALVGRQPAKHGQEGRFRHGDACVWGAVRSCLHRRSIAGAGCVKVECECEGEGGGGVQVKSLKGRSNGKPIVVAIKESTPRTKQFWARVG